MFRRQRGRSTRPGSACSQQRLHAVLRKYAPRRHADGENGRLRVFSELQVLFRPLKNHFGEREAEGLISLGKCLRGNWEAGSKFAAHSNRLRTLPRKEKSYSFLHSREILPDRA